MLEPNRLDPPRPYAVPQAAAVCGVAAARNTSLFVSPDDFDGTGILAGFDPCASNYWWMPELHAGEPADLAVTPVGAAAVHAARRTPSRPQAAA
ncbi:MAG: hypothetical protein ACOVJ6_07605 [Pirellulales bacterium]|jgi:hypothetical protein